LYLLENYLPFNDRNLLPPDIYAKALEYHLEQKVFYFGKIILIVINIKFFEIRNIKHFMNEFIVGL